MLRNALDATKAAGAKFVYFDNTYMYPQESRVQTEDTPFEPNGRKGRVRAAMAEMVLEEMAKGDIPVMIGRAPEFYGPGKTQGFTNTLVIDRLKEGKRPLIPVRDDKKRSLIWTPDASRALALLGNTPEAYGQTWHLPVDGTHPTYREFATMATETFGMPAKYTVVPRWVLTAAGKFNPGAKELQELLPRYTEDNIFDSSKFTNRFPDFEITSHPEGLAIIREESEGTRPA